jgi:hypothetical protein
LRQHSMTRPPGLDSETLRERCLSGATRQVDIHTRTALCHLRSDLAPGDPKQPSLRSWEEQMTQSTVRSRRMCSTSRMGSLMTLLGSQKHSHIKRSL